MKSILLLSAYDAQSHKYWRQGLCHQLPEYKWTVLSLPARYFSWRVRGNSLSWAYNNREQLNQHYDLVIATSMVDLSALRGMVPRLGCIPTIVYFHENQFAYPDPDRIKGVLEVQITSIYTALCADQVVFNSEFNQSTFIKGAQKLLNKMPDQVPKHVVNRIAQRSTVLPVPINNNTIATKVRSDSRHTAIMWNHRWEYDKGPDRLLSLINALPADLALTFHIAGQQFRQYPKEMTSIEHLLDTRGWKGQWGYVDNVEHYHALLSQSDIVLSTSRHDFQGLSILEAVMFGAIPVVPDRMSYPELFSAEYLYPSVENSINKEAELCAEKIIHVIEHSNEYDNLSIDRYTWPNLIENYRTIIESTLSTT